MTQANGIYNTDVNKTGLILTKMTQFSICVYLCVLLILLGCDSEDGNTTDSDYVDSWRLETPIQSSVSTTINGKNGQSEVIDVDGEMTVFLEFVKDGTINMTFELVSINPPLCSSQEPCNLQFTPSTEYQHQYIGTRLTPEGLKASFVRILNETNSDSTEGYIYLSEDRLCISNGLWDIMIIDEKNNTDPLAIDFNKCFVRDV